MTDRIRISLFVTITAVAPAVARADGGLRFSVSFPAERSATPIEGRVLLMLSTDGTREPRFQISNGLNARQVFGVDVTQLKPARTAIIESKLPGAR